MDNCCLSCKHYFGKGCTINDLVLQRERADGVKTGTYGGYNGCALWAKREGGSK